MAAQWIETNLPPNSRIARESRTGIIQADNLSVTSTYRLCCSLGSFDKTLTQQYDYFVTGESNYNQFFEAAEVDPEKAEVYTEQIVFYEKLFENELIAEFKPDPWKAAGTTIRIYRMSN
jgi:hypothetical protein